MFEGQGHKSKFRIHVTKVIGATSNEGFSYSFFSVCLCSRLDCILSVSVLFIPLITEINNSRVTKEIDSLVAHSTCRL